MEKHKNRKIMIIEVLEQKYKCGCNRGINKISEHGLLTKLNTVIEWDHCRGLDNLKKQENEDPELSPGDVFLYRGQVVAIDDPDSLILVVSETGGLALTRLWDEHISTEMSLMFNSNPLDMILQYEETNDDLPENLESYYPEYRLYNIFKDRFIKGRGFGKNFCIKVEITSEQYLFPITVYLREWTMLYDPEDLETDQLPSVAHSVISWFYENTSRTKESVDEYWARIDKEMGVDNDDISSGLSV